MDGRDQTPFEKRRLPAGMLTLAVLLVLALLAARLVWAHYAKERDSAARLQELSRQIFARSFSSFCSSMEHGDTKAVESDLVETGRRMPMLRICITDPDGRVAFASDKALLGKPMKGLLHSENAAKILEQALDPRDSRGPAEISGEMDGEPCRLSIDRIENDMGRCAHCHGSSRRILGAMVMARAMNAE